MGGAAAGEVASQMAVDILLRGDAPRRAAARPRRARARAGPRGRGGRRAHLRGRAARSHRAAAWARPRPSPCSSTRSLFLGQVGDSRALPPARRRAHAGHQGSVAGQPADRGRPAHRGRGRGLRALQHHPAGARHHRAGAGRPHLRRAARAATACCCARTACRGMVHGDEIREVARATIEDPTDCCERADRAAPSRRAVTTTSPSSSPTSTARAWPRRSRPDSFGYQQYPLPLDDEGRLRPAPQSDVPDAGAAVAARAAAERARQACDDGSGRAVARRGSRRGRCSCSRC